MDARSMFVFSFFSPFLTKFLLRRLIPTNKGIAKVFSFLFCSEGKLHVREVRRKSKTISYLKETVGSRVNFTLYFKLEC